MSNELQVTKEQTAQFVHDVMEMEKSIFTLDRAMADCEKKKKKILDEAHAKTAKVINKAKTKKERSENGIVEINERINSRSNWVPQYPRGVFWRTVIIVGMFIMLPIVALGGFWISEYFYCSMLAITIPLAIVALIITVYIGDLCAKRNICCQIRDNKAYIERRKERLIQLSEELRKAQNEYDNALFEQNRAIEPANLLDAQKKQLKENRDAISRSLTTCYENNIIKPKYRNIECVIIMNELYQNDRVDTMREAMDKCEERLFRDGVNAKLGQMVISLAEISSTLDSINFNLGMMSQDLFNISEQIAQGQREQQKSNEELIKETKLSRYAAERTAAAATYMQRYGAGNG